MTDDPHIGQLVAGEFRIEARVGTGGMGSVYRASQPEMNRDVAIKILHRKYSARPDLVSRFKREARAMSHLSHPNTARVFTYGQLEDGAWYMVLEFMEGKNLAQIIRAQGAMDPERAMRIMVQICGALEEAHRAGIIHRDLKPENIFLTNQGGIEDFPKLLDFGLAKVSERQMRPGSMILTQEGMVFGTAEFMSPEQASGEPLDARSDIYSLGVILYELVSGKLPFDAKEPLQFVKMHVEEPPIPLEERAPDIEFPQGLSMILQKCMAKKKEDRFQSAADVAKVLRDCLEGRLSASLARSVPTFIKKAPSVRPGVKSSHAPALSKASPGTLSWIVFGLGLFMFVAGAVLLALTFFGP